MTIWLDTSIKPKSTHPPYNKTEAEHNINQNWLPRQANEMNQLPFNNLAQSQQSNSGTSTSTSTASSNHHNVQFDENTTTPTPRIAPLPNVKLPQLPFPEFTGKYKDFINFREIFNATVGRANLTKLQKLSYLMQALKGECGRTINQLPVTDDNYDVAWEMLESGTIIKKNSRLKPVSTPCWTILH